MAEDAEVPLGGSPNGVEELVRTVKGQPIARDRLRETIDGINVDRAIRYGKLLGFLQQESETDAVGVTDLGTELFYATEGSSEQESIYIRAITAYDPYCRMSESLLSGRSDLEEITRSEVGQQIELGLGVERTSSTIDRGATTYLRTLVAAGVGTFKQGTSTTETRVEVNDSGTIDELVDSISSPSFPEDDGPQAAAGEEKEDTQSPRPNDNRTGDLLGERVGSTLSEETSSATLELNVNLELDGSEDPDRLQKLVAAVRSGWKESAPTDSDQPSSDLDTDIKTDHESHEVEEKPGDGGEETESDTSLNDF